jgi:hypothetical protein
VEKRRFSTRLYDKNLPGNGVCVSGRFYVSPRRRRNVFWILIRHQEQPHHDNQDDQSANEPPVAFFSFACHDFLLLITSSKGGSCFSETAALKSTHSGNLKKIPDFFVRQSCWKSRNVNQIFSGYLNPIC